MTDITELLLITAPDLDKLASLKYPHFALLHYVCYSGENMFVLIFQILLSVL